MLGVLQKLLGQVQRIDHLVVGQGGDDALLDREKPHAVASSSRAHWQASPRLPWASRAKNVASFEPSPIPVNWEMMRSSSTGPNRTIWQRDLVVGRSCSSRVHSRMIVQYDGGSSSTFSRAFWELAFSFSASLTTKTLRGESVGRIATCSMQELADDIDRQVNRGLLPLAVPGILQKLLVDVGIVRMRIRLQQRAGFTRAAAIRERPRSPLFRCGFLTEQEFGPLPGGLVFPHALQPGEDVRMGRPVRSETPLQNPDSSILAKDISKRHTTIFCTAFTTSLCTASTLPVASTTTKSGRPFASFKNPARTRL